MTTPAELEAWTAANQRARAAIPSDTASPCAIDGCNATARARGMCDKHYRQWKRTGRPERRGVRS
jgi:hypothetical protein